ncbi:hypothetical protein EJ05DRAFT_487233 [Pseudovirgaria hyperparasitica]|uniref:DUF7896 domain-containing protein n=1 Tax=Pseudovirgaria hyperparasitica TaxID=470096 RepID=A0A6A6W2U7_9PEZI|nr:uncharacterized protein EJ05DRAFT_487233 [Pseudovirgaria hyperparasitica]KAF2756316.1 hypothetical protein EJ05DRAFT_487233 [Pseudovirgaria hyperparasitica]
MQSALTASSSLTPATANEQNYFSHSLQSDQPSLPTSSWDKGRSPAGRSSFSSHPHLLCALPPQIAVQRRPPVAIEPSRTRHTSPHTAAPYMASPVRCMHPECLAAASSDDTSPRCLKSKPQIQTTQLRIPSPSSANPPNSSLNLQRTPTASSAVSSASTSAVASSPRHHKLYCPKCNDHPDGFRSEHELRRHANRVHVTSRKVWMTVDASPDHSFLSNCKSCTTGKRYNECYNAASHLRRMHFHPRKRGEGKGEKRGGAGSLRSEDPPMEVLKRDWLREVDESVAEGEERDEQYKMDIGEDEASETSPAQ